MAEELVQDTFVRLWRSAPRFDPGRGSVRTFTFVIAYSVASDLRRRVASRPLDVAPAAEVERRRRRPRDSSTRSCSGVWPWGDALDSLSENHAAGPPDVLRGGSEPAADRRPARHPPGTVKTCTHHAFGPAQGAEGAGGYMSAPTGHHADVAGYALGRLKPSRARPLRGPPAGRARPPPRARRAGRRWPASWRSRRPPRRPPAVPRGARPGGGAGGGRRRVTCSGAARARGAGGPPAAQGLDDRHGRRGRRRPRSPARSSSAAACRRRGPRARARSAPRCAPPAARGDGLGGGDEDGHRTGSSSCRATTSRSSRRASFTRSVVGPDDRPGYQQRISAGTFHPDEDGRSRVTLAAAVDPSLSPPSS